MTRLDEIAAQNMQTRFVDNPCRGIVLGRNEQGLLIQLSWIMGRSDFSQNRVYVVDGNVLRTEAADPSKLEQASLDPKLIIYNAMAGVTYGSSTLGPQVVSNGDQTNTTVEQLAIDPLEEDAASFDWLEQRHCEPDAPVFTPRITGYQSPPHWDTAYLSLLAPDLAARQHWAKTVAESGLCREAFRKSGMTELEITEAFNQEIGRLAELNHHEFPTVRQVFAIPVEPGFGYCLTTYVPGSIELNPFQGEPFLVPIRGDIKNVMQTFWEHLEPEWRVALGGKSQRDSGVYIAEPINRFEKVRG